MNSTDKNNFHKTLDKFLILKRKKYNYLDVGSSLPLNKFVKFIENNFKIFLFEPNITEYKKLKKKLSNSTKEYFIENKAIGLIKNLKINIYNNKNLSSALELNNEYNSLLPKYKLKKRIKVRAENLNKYISNNSQNVLKIDTQGYGYQCLKSAKKKLKNVPVLIIELEKYELYKKQYLNHDISKLLYDQNYIMIGNICNYNKSIIRKNRKSNLYFREITYSQDFLFIKNIFTQKLNDQAYELIIIFLTIFNFCDLAYFALSKSNLPSKLKLQLKNIINIKLANNKLIVKKLHRELLNNKISVKKFIESISWENENSIYYNSNMINFT
jgi:FkbM family methyltransferase